MAKETGEAEQNNTNPIVDTKPKLENLASATKNWVDHILKPERLPDNRLENWEYRLEMPMALLAIVYLGAYALPILYLSIPASINYLCDWLLVIIWFGFAGEYIFRLVIARQKWAFIRYNLLDLVIVTAPFFRPLRLLRLVFVLRALNTRAEHSMRGKMASYVLSGAFLLVFIGALAELAAEREAPNASIVTFGDAIWWAMVTMTTVGYGDMAPVTTEGRMVAMGLMIFGIALISSVTATVSSWLVEKINDANEANMDLATQNIQQEITFLRAELTEVNKKLDAIVNSINADQKAEEKIIG